MKKNFAIPVLIAVLVVVGLSLLVYKSGPDDNRSSRPAAIAQAPGHEAPTPTQSEEEEVVAEPRIAEAQEEEPGLPDQSAGETSPADSTLGTLDPYFVSEDDYIRVATFWSGQYRRDRDEWVNHLESELTRSDEELNSEDLEQLAVSAVLRDPRFKYNPPLTAEQLSPECSNLVCKVRLPKDIAVTRDFAAVQLVPGSRLNSYSEVMFTHGFGYHLVLNQRFEETTTHYFLANGYEM